MTAASRLGIATQGMRGGSGGTLIITGAAQNVSLEGARSVSKNDDNSVSLPTQFRISLTATPLTASRLDRFRVSEEQARNVTKGPDPDGSGQ